MRGNYAPHIHSLAHEHSPSDGTTASEPRPAQTVAPAISSARFTALRPPLFNKDWGSKRGGSSLRRGRRRGIPVFRPQISAAGLQSRRGQWPSGIPHRVNICARKSILLEWIAKQERGSLQSPNHESPD
jgi:hypothetical protein